MSYTAPQYVDTKEQAILALASVIADEDKGALGDGSVNKALDILADVLAEQDVQVPQTDAGAILALADYVSGGGGGIEWQNTSIQNNMVYMDRYDDDLDGWRVGVYGLSIFNNVNAGDIIGVRFDNVLYPIAAGKIGSNFYGRIKTAISGESFELNLYLDNEIWDEDFVILIKQGTATKEQLQTWAGRDHFLSIDYTSIV